MRAMAWKLVMLRDTACTPDFDKFWAPQHNFLFVQIEFVSDK